MLIFWAKVDVAEAQSPRRASVMVVLFIVDDYSTVMTLAASRAVYSGA